MNYFEQLAAVNCADKVKKKNNMNYLSWAFAWDMIKRLHPTAFYTIYENANGLFYHTDGKTAWVKTGVTVDVDGTMVEHIEYLPVMDYRNRSIPVGSITSFDVNVAIQRSLTKAVARHGLGLYIYAGEDIPDGEEKPVSESGVSSEEEPVPESGQKDKKEKASKFKRADTLKDEPVETFFCDVCREVVTATKKRDGTMWEPKDMAVYSRLKFDGRCLCASCMKKERGNA